jgi:uncharacterized protein YlxW (UPF0749 family)
MNSKFDYDLLSAMMTNANMGWWEADLKTESAKSNADKPKQYDNTANRKLLDAKRVSTLEAENIELKAKVKELEGKLERFGELNETLSEMGFMPR